jgi:penicillin-binding protein 1A
MRASAAGTRRKTSGLRRFLAACALAISITGPARADVFRSPEQMELIRLALTHPQIVVKRDGTGRFDLELCRCAVPVTLKQIAKTVPQALISTEDRHFYSSIGVEPEAIIRALLARGRQGGSGIDQQIAKNLLVGAAPTYERKWREALDALTVDGMFPKEEILTIYLNNMDWGTVEGHNIIGIEQAARAYFGKTAAALNLYESAMLIGMLKGPTFYSPIRHPQRARERAELVLNGMQTQGYITAAARAFALRTGPRRGRLHPLDLQTVYYTAWVRRMLDAMGPKLAGQNELRVVIGLDLRMQQDAERDIAEMLAKGRPLGGTQAALVAMNDNGLVRALIGGADFAENQLDRATMAHRQPGSAFKPFVYLRALELGRRPTDRVLDAPVGPNRWPRDFGGDRYQGYVTLSRALAQSLNGATARLAESIGLPGIAALAHRMGIESPLGDEPSLALGAYDVTPMELTSAYATIANDGRRVRPHGILAIATMQGDIVNLPAEEPEPREVAPAHIQALIGMLRGVVTSGTGVAANFGPGAIGKTGTTQENRDAWFVGFDRNRGLAAGIWIGNDANAPMRDVTGSSLPAEAWKRFFVAFGPPPRSTRVVAR